MRLRTATRSRPRSTIRRPRCRSGVAGACRASRKSPRRMSGPHQVGRRRIVEPGSVGRGARAACRLSLRTPRRVVRRAPLARGSSFIRDARVSVDLAHELPSETVGRTSEPRRQVKRGGIWSAGRCSLAPTARCDVAIQDPRDLRVSRLIWRGFDSHPHCASVARWIGRNHLGGERPARPSRPG